MLDGERRFFFLQPCLYLSPKPGKIHSCACLLYQLISYFSCAFAFRYLVAVGTESGRIALYSWAMRPMADWNILVTLDQSYPAIYLKPAKYACLSSFFGAISNVTGNRLVLSLV